MIYLKTSIGIELQEKDMVLSSLQGNFSGGSLTHFMRISDYRNRDTAELRQEIQAFLKNNILGKDNIVLGIPRRDVLFRQLDLPAEVADNLKQVIQYQVQSFEPTDEDSYYHDYTLLDRSGKNKRLHVLVAMVRKSILDNHLQLMSELGIQPAVVTCGTLALTNVFLQDRKKMQDKNYVLANTAASSLELIVVHDGIPVYSQETAKNDSLSWKDLVLQELDEATSRIRLEPGSVIEEIVLAGDSSETVYGEIREAIAECALLKDAAHFKSAEETRPYLQQAATAISLAYTGMMRHPSFKINLLPAAFRFKQTRWAYISAAVLGLIILALLAGLFIHGQIQDRELVQVLDEEISEIKPDVAVILESQRQTEELEKEIDFIESLFRSKDKNLYVLQELTTMLPDDTYLYNYRNQEGRITISGLGGSASDLIPLLESSPLLKEVAVQGNIQRDNLTGKDRFTIIAKLEE
jgi:Tfp pilus assembly PilM family ATPase/Tfp pilus assembly protein PilN